MITIQPILLFIFVFSTLVVLRTVMNFTLTLLRPVPEKFVLRDRERLVFAIALSYIITYILT
jgi:hypothetical protein